MNEPIAASFRWTVDEALRAQRCDRRRRLGRWMPLIWLAVLLSLGHSIFQFWRFGTVEYSSFLSVIAFILVFYVVVPWIARAQFAKRPDRDSEVTWIFSNEKIQTRWQHGTADFLWSALSAVRQTPDGFLFYSTPQIFHWLPRSAFASEAACGQVADLARSKVAKFEVIKGAGARSVTP